MMKIHAMAMIMILGAAAAPAQDGSGPWKLRLEKQGIRIYSNRVPGSPIDELKGECVLDASLEVVGQVMLDVPSYPQWVADCVEARKFGCSSVASCLLYFTLGMPWPVRDRDIVLQSSTEVFLRRGVIIGTVTALREHVVPKHDSRVRITSMYGKWIFERLSADKTRATFLCWADPAGYIPAFVINAASLDVPYRTLKGLQAMVTKEAYSKAAENFDMEALDNDNKMKGSIGTRERHDHR